MLVLQFALFSLVWLPKLQPFAPAPKGESSRSVAKLDMRCRQCFRILHHAFARCLLTRCMHASL